MCCDALWATNCLLVVKYHIALFVLLVLARFVFLPCLWLLLLQLYSIEVREIAGRKIIVLNQQQDEDTSVATIMVRAATENVINDIERALDDGIYSVKTLCSDGRLLPGAGATELELGKRLKAMADEDKSLDQYGLRQFAAAFDVVPRTLAENSGTYVVVVVAGLGLGLLFVLLCYF
jgi:chaperonin GroEL (HSP60 family)